MTRGTSKKGHNKKTTPTHSLRPWTAMLTHFFSGATFPAGPGLVFFFAAAPRGRSLTHCGPGRRCLPPGWCFFLLPDQGGVFFFSAVAPPRRSLTHCGLGRFRQGPGGVFVFGCGPAEPGEPITKNVWCTTSGLKRPGGATLHGEVLKTASGRRARSSCSPTWLGTPRVHSKPPACTA